MRTASLFALAILLPVVLHAAALVNINTASAALLDTLPGVGPAKAAAIVDYRTKHGPFASITDIQKVKGIGSGSTYAKIAPLITVDVQHSPPSASLNTVKTVEPIIKKTNTQAHAETVVAPMAEVEPAAVGAAATAELPIAVTPPTPQKTLLTSPWTIGLIGVIVLAGGAFIFL